MRNLRRFIAGICLITVLTLSTPVVTFALDDGPPQGGSNSTKTPPPPPPPPPPSGSLGTLVATLINLLY